MSIFQSIANTAGSLFNSFKGIFSSGGIQTANAASALGPSTYTNPYGLGNAGGAYGTAGYYASNPQTVAAGATGVSNTPAGQSSYTPQYGGTINSVNVPSNVGAPNSASYNAFVASNPQGTQISGGSSSGGSVASPYMAPQILTKASGSQYAKSVGLNGLNLEGKTYQEADQAINAMKGNQRGQVNANTSAVFGPEVPGKVSSRVNDLSLSLDNINNNGWMSAPSKADELQTMLKATATDLADQFDSQQAMISAYDSNPKIQQAFDKFAQLGGSDQMLIDAVTAKQSSKIPAGWDAQTYANFKAANPGLEPDAQDTAMMQNAGNNQTTADYLAKTINGDKIITDEIARTAQIPTQLKDKYFGDAGIWQQRLNLAQENVNLLRTKITNEENTARQTANYHMEKNNAELAVAKNTIEMNRVNAKNYLTGMLAKLGALNTTSAAADGITVLDQKYQQQSADAESKTRFANQEIQLDLQSKINTIESTGNDKIQSIKEDLSKDRETMVKEITKAQEDADKRVYDLTLKASDRMEKNNKKYTQSATALAEEYTVNFNSLVSQGFDPASIAGAINVKLPAADQKISSSARIKDPNSIAYFKSLPTEFRNQWIQFASTQPAGTYFTTADLQANYEPYVLDKQQKSTNKTKASSSSSFSASDL